MKVTTRCCLPSFAAPLKFNERMSLKNALADRLAELQQKAGDFRNKESKWMGSVMTRLNLLSHQPPFPALVSRGDLNCETLRWNPFPHLIPEPQ